MCPTAEEQQDWDVGFESAPVACKDRKTPTLSRSCWAGETDSQPHPCHAELKAVGAHGESWGRVAQREAGGERE